MAMPNHKQMYVMLKAQLKALKPEAEQPNKLPEGFNQNGWEWTEQKVEQLHGMMRSLRERKGKRLTPRFYEVLYNRCIIAIREAEQLLDRLAIENEDIDFEAECFRLMDEIQRLKSESGNTEENAE